MKKSYWITTAAVAVAAIALFHQFGSAQQESNRAEEALKRAEEQRLSTIEERLSNVQDASASQQTTPGAPKQDADGPVTIDDMKMVGLAYQSALVGLKRAPNDADELAKYFDQDARLLRLLKSGRITVLFKIQVNEIAATTVIAYEGNADKEGGLVVMGDGSALQMTAEKFKGASLPNRPSSAATNPASSKRNTPAESFRNSIFGQLGPIGFREDPVPPAGQPARQSSGLRKYSDYQPQMLSAANDPAAASPNAGIVGFVHPNSPLQQIVDELRETADQQKRDHLIKQLTELVSVTFDQDLTARVDELSRVEERIKKLRTQLDRRLQAKAEIIDLQIKVLVNEADGLGFSSPSAESSSNRWLRTPGETAPAGANPADPLLESKSTPTVR